MPPAARLGDMHVCPMQTPAVVPIPHVGGPIIAPCALTVLIGNMPAARITDMCICVGPPDVIVKGSMGVYIMGLNSARIGDNTAHGGVIVQGWPTVIIGEIGSGVGGGSTPAMPPGMPKMPSMPSVPSVPSVPSAPNVPSAPMPGIPAPVMDREHDNDEPSAPASSPNDEKISRNFDANITVTGSKEFVDLTMKHLAQIKKTPSGAKMFEDFRATRKNVVIVKGRGINGCETVQAKANFRKDAAVPGIGSDSRVLYDPDVVSTGFEDWGPRPPAIGLAHELVHATHNARGERDPSPIDNDGKMEDDGTHSQAMKEEVRTIGIPPFDKEPYSENTFRSEWDPPQPARPYY